MGGVTPVWPIIFVELAVVTIVERILVVDKEVVVPTVVCCDAEIVLVTTGTVLWVVKREVGKGGSVGLDVVVVVVTN